MKYIKSINESNDEDLLNSIKSLSQQMSRLKGFVQYNNRGRVKLTKGKLDSEFRQYFLDMEDDGWEYWPNIGQFCIRMVLKNAILKKDAESELNYIVDRMSEIKDRLSEEGFDSKFLIFYNGKGQMVDNPNSYREPLFKYTGIGDELTLKYFKDGKYSDDDYLFAKIDYVII